MGCPGAPVASPAFARANVLVYLYQFIIHFLFFTQPSMNNFKMLFAIFTCLYVCQVQTECRVCRTGDRRSRKTLK
jgi:DNA phosphorothioation-dependent restriction protein DptG